MSTLQRGLTNSQAKDLQSKFGYNELPIKDPKNLLKTLVRVITEPMFALLLLAGFIYLLIGGIEDALILLCFIGLSVGITAYQERKSERAIEALKDLSSPRALVIRNGQYERIAGRDVVVGDLLVLEEGDRIAADAKIIECHDLLVDESLLTGESEPIEKLQDELVHSGSLLVRGGGTALVIAIGIHTEIGKIGKSLEQISNIESPLQADIRVLIKRFAIFGISLSIVVCLIYGFIYQDWITGALSGISLTMALLPEEFTVILTVFMALGVWRISREQVLTRHTPVIETLGSINTLCVDKTGTLTVNKMTLQALATPNQMTHLDQDMIELNTQEAELLSYAVLASEIAPFDPMEIAFHESMKRLYPQHQSTYKDHVIVHEYGLSPQLPAMTHIWQSPQTPYDYLVAIKGSPEAVLNLCHISEAEKKAIEDQIQLLASQGLRLLGIAKSSYQNESGIWPNSVDGFQFEWLGLVSLKDPLRREVPAAVKQCQEAGIRVIMITGDHATTAQAIAKQAGIPSDQTMSGAQINDLTDRELQVAIRDIHVFVRIKPKQKLRLVKALQANHEIVAMTGDGVNDAPALKAAHVGIAMGQRGTDVAREAASLVLLNDDFSSIVNAIKQGRQIYDNLRKAIIYVIAVHIPIAGAVFIPLLLGVPPILTPIHILFLEMIIDPSCAIVFEMEAPESNVMQRPPRASNEKIFNFQNSSLAILQGLGLLIIVIGLYLALMKVGETPSFASTIAFGSLMLGNLSLIIVSRSKQLHFFAILKRRNSSQYWIIGSAISLFSAFLLTPFLRERFGFAEITIEGVILILFSGLIGLIWYEAIKIFYRIKPQ